MTEQLAIAVDTVSKTFSIPRNAEHTLKERALHPFRRSEVDKLRALREITFGVRKGEFFGIVGRNGSGKSTLMKCMAGIYRIDSGRIFVDGRMSTFIELGVGFNPDLAARDNIIINGTMLGLSPREARYRSDKVLDFAELQEFVDLKVKNYSSGMMVRLAFSVMIQVDADVLLIDEVLAVGDAAFQQKCFEEFARIHASNATVVLVTHDMGAVDRFCDRAILLEHGRMVHSGAPRDVGNRYLELNFSRAARAEAALAEAQADAAQHVTPPDIGSVADPGDQAPTEPVQELRMGDGRAQILSARFEHADGTPADTLQTGDTARFVMQVRFEEELESPVFSVTLRNTAGDVLLSATTLDDGPTGRFRAGEEVDMSLTFENYLAADRYQATAAVSAAGSGLAWHDHREGLLSVVVTSTTHSSALVQLPTTIDIHRESTSSGLLRT
jgi:ABC-2 type transport system ATP-binding protein